MLAETVIFALMIIAWIASMSSMIAGAALWDDNLIGMGVIIIILLAIPLTIFWAIINTIIVVWG